MQKRAEDPGRVDRKKLQVCRRWKGKLGRLSGLARQSRQSRLSCFQGLIPRTAVLNGRRWGKGRGHGVGGAAAVERNQHVDCIFTFLYKSRQRYMQSSLMPLLNFRNPFLMLGSVWISVSEAGVHRRDCLRGAMEGRLNQVGWSLGRPSVPATRAGRGAG